MAPLDPTILGSLYRQHAAALRLYARQWAGHAEDLVQEAFVRLARQAPPPEHVLPWLYRVVRNQSLAEARGAQRRRLREAGSRKPEAWFAVADDKLDAQEATRLLAELGLELREVIVARIWGGLTFADIAQLVGCSLATAQRRYEAGIGDLRERLDRQWTKTHSLKTI